MSSVNTGLKLMLKKSQWLYQSRAAPDLFVFESNAMLKAATKGRGIPKQRTAVIPLGVETSKYTPDTESRYAYNCFSIPVKRKIIFSGHMEERKVVRVLIQAILELENRGALDNYHLLICGNKGEESKPYEDMLGTSKASSHVTFAGYRNDIPELMSSSFVGTISSTGWDSFTMSSVEMLSSGLPLIVSELQGLKETIVPGVCGYYIKPGDAKALAGQWEHYGNHPEIYLAHSFAARKRAESEFSSELQTARLNSILSNGAESYKAPNCFIEGHQ